MTSTLGAPPTTGTSDDSGSISHAKDLALEKTSDVRSKIGSTVTDRVREQADQRSTQVGEHVSSIASALQGTSSSLREGGDEAPAKAVEAVTKHVENVGSYLSNVDGETLLHDIEDAARKRPWATAATLFGIGFAASRVLGASSRSRYEARGGQVARGRSYGASGGYTPYPSGAGSTLTSGTANVPTVGGDGYSAGGATNGGY